MKKMTVLVFAALLTVPAGAAAQEFIWEGPWTPYTQRVDSVTIGAGNAMEANTAIHATDPSPRHARNRSFPTSGERMQRTIRRYQDVTKLIEAARAPAAETSVSGGSQSSGK